MFYLQELVPVSSKKTLKWRFPNLGYTQKRLDTAGLYTEKLSHTEGIYTEKHVHTANIYTQKLVFTHRSSQKLLLARAFTQRFFYTQQAFTHSKHLHTNASIYRQKLWPAGLPKAIK